MNNSNSETPTSTYSSSPSISSLTTPDGRVPGYEIVLPLGVTLVTISSICTSYVIVRTLIRWWNTRRSLSMALRVPFYIAISDFMLISTYFPNLLFPLIHGHPWPEGQCRIIGGATFFFISCNMTLVGSLASLTYLRICRKWYIDLGRYDYKLFCFLLVLSLTFTIFGIPSFGASKYWCFTNHNNAIMPIITLILNFTILTITLFSYTMTLRQINSINFCQEPAIKFDTAATKSKQIEPVVVRKIVGYVLIFLFQWTPPMIYVFSQVINYDEMWIYIVTDATINLGGMGNMIQYIINEGWWDSRESSTTTIDSNSTPPYNISVGTTSLSTENHRKSRNIKENANDVFNNDLLSPPKALFSSGHLSQITVEEVITVVVEESPAFGADPTDGDTPIVIRSRPNSIVTFNIDRENGEKELSHARSNSPTCNDIKVSSNSQTISTTAPSPAIKITEPSQTISTIAPSQTTTYSQTISITPSQNIMNTSTPTHNLVQTSPTHNLVQTSPTHNLVQTSPTHSLVQTSPTHNLVQTSPTHANTSNTESTDRIHVSELEKIIIRHNKAVLKHGGSLARQGGTMLHRDHGLRSIRSEEGINRHLASSQGSNDNGDSNGCANIGSDGGARRFMGANGSVNRSKSLNNGSLSRSRSGSLNSNNSCRGRSGSESSNKGLIGGERVNGRLVKQSENVIDKEDESYL